MSASASPPPSGYRFRSVELDLARMSLRVGGAEVAAPRLALRLLQLLCERGGALCTRAEIFDAVWPRQEVSDDALNKLASRLRELLGAEAAAIVTVRKQGLRLDAEMTRLARPEPPPATPQPAVAAVDAERPALPPDPGPATATEPEPPPAPAAAAAEPALPERPSPARWRRRLLAFVPVLLLGLLLGWRLGGREPGAAAPAGDDALVFRSYALRASDLRAARPETAALLQAAEQALDRSDAAQARRLLHGAEQGEPGSALLPALRALFRGSDEAEPAAALLQRARARLGPQDSPYARLLVAYAEAGAQDAAAERAAIDALLTLRPEAWRLRLRRAHLDIQVGNGSGALRHLRAIPVAQAPPATAMLVLADRVSYGDGAAVQRELDGGALAGLPLQRQYVLARLAWSARAPDAGSRFEALADAAEADAAFVLAAHARELAAAHAYLGGDPQAAARLQRAAHGLKQAGRAEYAAPLLALAAELAHAAGRAEDARALLRQALAAAGPAPDRVELEILNARLGLLPRGSFLETAGGTDDRFGRGQPALVAGWHALARGDRAQAAAALAEARASGIESSPHGAATPLAGLAIAVLGVIWLLRGLVLADLLPALAVTAAGLYAALPLLDGRGLLPAARMAQLRGLGPLLALGAVAIAGLHLVLGAMVLV